MDFIERLSQDPRVTIRKSGAPIATGKCVVYWMQRAQRALDNPSLDIAIQLANELRRPLVAFFAPVPFYPHANLRHYRFLAEGIPDIADELAKRNVGFVLRTYPQHHLHKFCQEVEAAIVVGDENPMREPEEWRRRAAKQLQIPLWTVDADVIVPSKLFGKEHFAAHTIRPKMNALLPQFLLPQLNADANIAWRKPEGLSSLPVSEDFTAGWKLDRSVSPVMTRRGGSKAALSRLEAFVENELERYAEDRNHPEIDGTSRLSPYLHFGHISPITVALAVRNSPVSEKTKEAFFNELVTWRELAINFVKYNPSYDTMECLEPWANRSLSAHSGDERPVLYTDAQLDQAETHDPLWNAAQKQMVLTGWMHNYMRMYWAKKILEWSSTIVDAFRRAVWLNDRYEIDGRDPNGYAGIAWAIVGKHDRAWFDRPIFGQIRYMSFASTSRKFNSKKYIEQITQLERGRSEDSEGGQLRLIG